MNVDGDDLEAAYFFAHRFVNQMRAAGGPVNAVIESFYRNVDLLWRTAAHGSASCCVAEESGQVIDTAEAAHILGSPSGKSGTSRTT